MNYDNEVGTSVPPDANDNALFDQKAIKQTQGKSPSPPPILTLSSYEVSSTRPSPEMAAPLSPENKPVNSISIPAEFKVDVSPPKVLSPMYPQSLEPVAPMKDLAANPENSTTQPKFAEQNANKANAEDKVKLAAASKDLTIQPKAADQTANKADAKEEGKLTTVLASSITQPKAVEQAVDKTDSKKEKPAQSQKNEKDFTKAEATSQPKVSVPNGNNAKTKTPFKKADPLVKSPSLAPITTAKTDVKANKSPISAKSPGEKVPLKNTTTSHMSSKRHILDHSDSLKPRTTIHGNKDANGPNQKSKPMNAHVKSTGSNTQSAQKKPVPVAIIPPATNFVKPKPKSPTKPIKLPSSLIAPTASSVSKTGTSARHGPTKAALHPPPTIYRSPSRASVGSVSHASRPALRRQSSTINQQRPSIGPPPKPLAKDHPPTKQEKEMDQDFLARMMRPTQSSNAKVHDKLHAPSTPPRRSSSVKRGSEIGIHSLKPTPTKRAANSRASTPHKFVEPPQQETPSSVLPTSKTPSISEEEESRQPSSVKTDELGDDTLVEKGDSPVRKANETQSLTSTALKYAIPNAVETLVETEIKDGENAVSAEPTLSTLESASRTINTNIGNLSEFSHEESKSITSSQTETEAASF